MTNEQAGGLNQDPNVRAQYQSVLQELMLFFQIKIPQYPPSCYSLFSSMSC